MMKSKEENAKRLRQYGLRKDQTAVLFGGSGDGGGTTGSGGGGAGESEDPPPIWYDPKDPKSSRIASPTN
ncbi:MAG: hypothetical protein WBB45_13560 [Cyclobacteriaceae bacterium]